MGLDPGWTDATRDLLHKRLGVLLGMPLNAHVIERWLHPQNTTWLLVMRHGDEGGTLLTNWAITAGVIGADTDVDGRVWGDVEDETPGAGQATVNVYADSARSNLAATGAANNGATVTLAAQSGYNFAGTVDIGTISGNFDWSGFIIPPAYEIIRALFSGQTEDTQMMEEIFDQLQLCRQRAIDLRNAFSQLAPLALRSIVARNLPALSSENTIIAPNKQREASTGRVFLAASGLLEDLRRAQADNTGGSGEIKATQGAWTGTVAWDWTGKETTATFNQRALVGVVTAQCNKGLDARPPTFRVTFRATDTRKRPDEGKGVLVSSIVLTIGAQFIWPEIGLATYKVDYAPTAANGTGSAISTTSTDWSVTGLTSGNSDAGKLWGIADGSGASANLKFYDSEANRDADGEEGLVCIATTPGTSSAFTTDTSDSGIAVSGTTGGTINDNDTFTVDFNAPTPETPASRFTLTIAETTEAHRWSKVLRDGFAGGQPWYPNAGSGGNLDEGWIEAGQIVCPQNLFGGAD